MKDVLDKIDSAFDLADRFFGIDSRAQAATSRKPAPAPTPARPVVKQIAGPVTGAATPSGRIAPRHLADSAAHREDPAAKTIEAIDETGATIWIVKRGDHEMICNSRALAARASRMLDGAL